GSQGNNTAIAIDNIGVTAYGSSNCAAAMGTGYLAVPSLPFHSGPGSTCGMVDDLTDVNTPVCGDPAYLSDEDMVWSFTPTTTGNLSIDLNAPFATSTGLMLYDGCPAGACSGSSATCVAFIQDVGGSKSLCVSVIAGHTYYVVLDGANGGLCNDFDDLYISSVNTSTVGSTCANPVVVASLPATYLNESTACMGDDYNAATIGSCGSIYSSGEDKVYQYISAGNECISISLSNLSTPLMGYEVYYGCPGAGGVCIATNGGASVLVGSVTLSAAGTYYIIIDSWAPPFAVGYDMAIVSYGAGVSNDLPCNAQLLTHGIYTLGNNNCSSGVAEPIAGDCWTFPGTLNTVWYKAVVGATGEAHIQTQLLTLTDTQIDVFTGTCNDLIPVLNGCNDNGASGCSGLISSSSLDLYGLTPGETIFIRVDGVGDLTGTFNIIITDSPLNAGFNQQDCLGGTNVCQNVIVQPSSFFGCGMIPEIPLSGSFGNPDVNVSSTNSGCLLASELNIVWYIIHISSPGTLSWTHTHPSGFYDWIMYDLTNNSCADIANNILPPVRCNWNGAGSTMCGMQNPVPGGASPFNFEAPLPVLAGQTFALALSNYSYTSGGFTLDFSNSTCGFGNSPTLAWNGQVNTTWTNTTNWGGCNSLSCGVDANIFPAPNQPVISANASIKNLNILAGASLTIQPGVTLSLCGDFNNYGTLIASPTSTIVMNNGSVIQHFDGSLTGTNKLGNVVINKTGGSVIANVDMDIVGNFTTSTANSIFDSNNKYITLSGNFNNLAGNATYINSAPTGTLELNGTGLQNFNPGGALDLNFVKINNSGAGVNLLSGNMNIGVDGNLDLTLGKIITNANKVTVKNPTFGAVFNHSALSYVEGNLQRMLSALPDIYEFPVGHSLKGYQNASVTITAANTIPDLTASFHPYTAVPIGPVTSVDCYAVDYSQMQVLDNGYWSIIPSANNGTVDFSLSLYPSNFTSAANYTTVLSSTVAQPTALTWYLDGTCDPGSSAAQTNRNLMNQFGHFGIGQGTASGTLPIELISFKGAHEGNINHLKWITATEIDNDFFTLERSVDAVNFAPITVVDGSGTTTLLHNYSFNDKNFKSGINYYRLKQTDFNGNYTYSDVISIRTDINVSSIHSWPNPVKDILHLKTGSDITKTYKAYIYDIAGRLVLESSLDMSDVTDDFEVNLQSLDPGTYMISIIDNEGIQIGTSGIIKE
ncbi:MAG TPA: T9SS type A sorting domain-containing protein, partial [Bacteroidia bacterium]|nr:T9SS type A sorting domain-containing protein [Bacteroidia bacterium]